MNKVELLRAIADNYRDLADETYAYRERLFQFGASSTHQNQLFWDYKSLLRHATYYSIEAATEAAGIAKQRLTRIKAATDEAKDFLATMERVTLGIQMVGALVGLAAAGMRADAQEGIDALVEIERILEEARNED